MIMTCRRSIESAALLLLLLVCALPLQSTTALDTAVPVYVHDVFSKHAPPSQIHIALADNPLDDARLSHARSSLQRVGMTVSWATAARTKTSVVRISQNPANFSLEVHAATPCEQYDFCSYTSPWFHHVVIDSAQLLAGTMYYCT